MALNLKMASIDTNYQDLKTEMKRKKKNQEPRNEFEFKSVYWPFLATGRQSHISDSVFTFHSLIIYISSFFPFFSFLINIIVHLYSSLRSSLRLVLDIPHVVLVHIPWNSHIFFVYSISLFVLLSIPLSWFQFLFSLSLS
jgi:hypothetical protein